MPAWFCKNFNFYVNVRLLMIVGFAWLCKVFYEDGQIAAEKKTIFFF